MGFCNPDNELLLVTCRGNNIMTFMPSVSVGASSALRNERLKLSFLILLVNQQSCVTAGFQVRAMGVDTAAVSQVLAKLLRAAAVSSDVAGMQGLCKDLAAAPSVKNVNVEALAEYKPASVSAVSVPVPAAARDSAGPTGASRPSCCSSVLDKVIVKTFLSLLSTHFPSPALGGDSIIALIVVASVSDA